jgi:hypothetical protein
MPTLVHPELSYQVRGVLLHVYNALGPMLPEAYYEAAIALVTVSILLWGRVSCTKSIAERR